jgi:broad specificity phosphatase PhoE
MIKNIYLIRHGETEYNKLHIVQGSGVDTSINETGRKQAHAFFEAYKHIVFDKIYISNLKRTYESVEEFIKMGIPYQKTESLNEISWGKTEGMPFSEDTHQYYLDTVADWQQGNTHLAVAEGESPEQVAKRQKPILEILKEQHSEGNFEQNILVCMHGRAMRVLLTQIFGYPLRYMDVFEHYNLAFYHLTFTGSMFQILKYNSIEHLKKLG